VSLNLGLFAKDEPDPCEGRQEEQPEEDAHKYLSR
jgi:hypothetical protein